MLGKIQINIIESLNFFISCESNHDKNILAQISSLDYKSNVIYQLFQGKKMCTIKKI